MSGLGSFIQGAFSGYEYGEQNKDRKTRRKREEENYDWTRESRDQQRTNWDNQNAINERNRTEQARLDAAAATERSVLAAAYENAEDTYQGGQPVPVDGTNAATVETMPQGPERGVGDARASTPTVPDQAEADARAIAEQSGYAAGPEGVTPPNSATAPQSQYAPQQGTAPTQDMPPQRPMEERGRQSQLAEQAAMLGDDISGYGPGMVDPRAYAAAQNAPAGRSVMLRPSQPAAPQAPDQPPSVPMQRDPQATERLMNDYGVLSDPALVLMAERQGMTPEAYFQTLGETARQQHIQRVSQNNGVDYNREAPYLNQIPSQQDLDREYRNQSVGIGTVPAGMQAPAAPERSAMPRQAPNADPAPQREAPAGLQAPPAQSPSGPAQVGGPASAPITAPEAAAASVEGKTTEELHAEATGPIAQGGAPSVQSAADTAPTEGRGVLGQDGPVKTTQAQRDRAAMSFLDHYAETAVPQIVQHYLSTGNIEKAQAFEEWATGRETQRTLESYGRMVHAAAIGDDEGVLDYMAETMNSFDDGYEVVRDGSGFERDEAGNITGATVLFKNTETGETFERKFEDQADIIEMGIYAMSPEKIFDYLFGQIAAANEITAESLAHERKLDIERVKNGSKREDDNTALIAAAKRHLSEANYNTWAGLSPEEQDQMAIDYVRSNRAAGAQLDNAPPPPPYLGD